METEVSVWSSRCWIAQGTGFEGKKNWEKLVMSSCDEKAVCPFVIHFLSDILNFAIKNNLMNAMT